MWERCHQYRRTYRHSVYRIHFLRDCAYSSSFTSQGKRKLFFSRYSASMLTLESHCMECGCFNSPSLIVKRIYQRTSAKEISVFTINVWLTALVCVLKCMCIGMCGYGLSENVFNMSCLPSQQLYVLKHTVSFETKTHALKIKTSTFETSINMLNV